jgi:stage III sporulation protein AG
MEAVIMNDKLKNMFKGKKKTENIIVLIVILIITAVAINYIWKDSGDNNVKETKKIETNAVQVSAEVSQNEIETKLEDILSHISGVGKVRVMITYSETSTINPVYNEDSKTSNINETDSGGGTRTTTEVIYKENKDGSKEPVTQSIISPKIEGAIIAAQGASNATIKANIIQAVEAATGLATHKIQVFKMEDN